MRVEGAWKEIISRVWDLKDHTWEQGMRVESPPQGMPPPQAVAGPKVPAARVGSCAARDDGAL